MLPFDLLIPHPPDRRGREPEVNAWIELHNLLVAAESPGDLEADPVARIRRQRGVDLRERFYKERVRFYEEALDWALAETPFEEADRQRLAAIAHTLHLSAHDREMAHQRAFGVAVHHALADNRLSVDERLLLYKLQHTLGFDPEIADGAFEVMARERLLVTVARVLTDGVLSHEEAEEVERTRSALGVTMPVSLRKRLDEAARQWHRRVAAKLKATWMRPWTWRGRWRALYAAERDALFRNIRLRSSELSAYPLALQHLPPSSGFGWRGQGEIRVGSANLIFKGKYGRNHARLTTIHDAYRHGRLVWVVRRSGHDWLVEIENEEEARRFAHALLGRESA